MRNIVNDVMMHFSSITTVNAQNKSSKKRLSTLKIDMVSLQTSHYILATAVESNLKLNNDIARIIKVLFKNNYGDEISTKNPMRKIHKLNFERLKEQAIKAYQDMVLGEASNWEMSNLKSEVGSLKQSNLELTENVKVIGTNSRMQSLCSVRLS